VTIPDLRGQGRRAARAKLQQLGFGVTEREQPDDAVGENRVIETSPSASGQLEKGQTVTLVVSTGKERVQVPDVTGRPRDEATSTLEAAGLHPVVREQESGDKDPGTVLSQDPPSGKGVRKGTTVTITVAKEPQDQAVPSVVDRTEAQAVEDLSGAGFKIRERQRPVDDPAQDGKVLDQNPPAGKKVKKGATVTITIGTFDPTQAPGTTTPDTTTTTTTPLTTTTTSATGTAP
jgi:serine/threonine-protein kinase